MRVVTVPSFFGRAAELRRHFENRVGPERGNAEGRFVWDYWHIPSQFTYFRTPAISVIPPSLLAEFTEALRSWGRTNLGADRVTVPWLSFYIEGCRQELHSDVIQGTWSYVYSLTEWEQRQFTGGETLLAAERLLDYWSSFDPTRSSESRHLIDRIPSLFGQLCVFDSRLPHGVAAVEGTRDPLRARVALHGWFHPPELRVEGALAGSEVEPVVTGLRARWNEENEHLGGFRGSAVWRVSVGAGGRVEECKLVAENLVSADGDADPSEVLAVAESLISECRFPASSGASSVLLPLS